MRKRFAWLVAGVLVVGVILAGGQAPGPDWQKGSDPHWSGRSDGTVGDLVPVTMHDPSRAVALTPDTGQDLPEFEYERWPDVGKVGVGAASIQPPVDLGAIERRTRALSADSLFGETDPSKTREPRSGWGWLADETARMKEAEVEAARQEVESPWDSRSGGGSLDTGAGGQTDPYADLYDKWGK